MKRLLAPAAFVLTALSLTFAWADEKAEKPKGDLGKLQGKWTSKVKGPDNQEIPILTIINGKTASFKVTIPDGREIEFKGEIKIDEQSKPHKTIDWVKFTTPMGDAAPDNLGIYEIVDENTIKVCNGGPGNERPSEFKESQDGPPRLLTMKREVEPAKK